MRSPYTGKEMKRGFETIAWKFRGEVFPCIKEYWECGDTGERFTTTEGDQNCYIQATNQYRVAHGIPFADEIVGMRKRYRLSARKIAKILGIGYNQYRGYENGDVPSESNGKLMRSISSPVVMRDMIYNSADIMGESSTKEIIGHLNQLISQAEDNIIMAHELKRIFGVTRGAENGYAHLSIEKLKNLLLYVLQRCENVWVTKMNKLLFYIDFISYRDNGYAISGLSYLALDYGPVPRKWAYVYSLFDEIQQVPCSEQDFSGHLLSTREQPDLSLFSEEERRVMDKVCNTLGSLSASRLSELSHQEDSWLKKHKSHGCIDYSDAFTIRAL